MTRELIPIEGNSQKLDGGAMFGNCPKVLWERWIAPDERGRIPLACRALLVRENNRTILFETGVGAFFEPKLRDRYGVVEAEHVLLHNLERAGCSHEQIDVVVLSHLHFDHAGGLLTAYQENTVPQLLFPRATFIVGAEAWQRAANPHPRDRASFIPGLLDLLEGSGRLELVEGETSPTLGKGYRFHRSNGHTPGMLVTEIETEQGPVVFAADLIPGLPWTHVPITMGYDRYPELLIDEKSVLLESLHSRGGMLFYTHDPRTGLAKLQRDEKGRYSGVPILKEST